MNLLSGMGAIGWDFGIGVGATLIGLIHFWRLGAFHNQINRFFRIGRFIAGIGWFSWGIRFVVEVIDGGDPKISLPGLLSITFIIAGTLLINLLGNAETKDA